MPSKRIKESWDKINPNNAADERMLTNILNHKWERNRSRLTHAGKKERKDNMSPSIYWKIISPIAACIIVALIVAVPFFMQDQPSDINPPQAGAGTALPTESPEADTEIAQATPIQPTPQAIPIDEPHLNEVSSHIAGRVGVMAFSVTLAEEETRLVLPGITSRLYATATYLYDGTLLGVTAVEVDDDNSTPEMGGFTHIPTIEISPTDRFAGGIHFISEPIYSYILDVALVAGINTNIGFSDDNTALFTITFEMDGVFYLLTLIDYDVPDGGLQTLTDIAARIIQGGPADLSVLADPEIPELRHDTFLTLEDVMSDPDFGAFLPTNIPSGLQFGAGTRIISQHSNMLIIDWHQAWRSTVTWSVSAATDFHHERIVSIYEREKFDLSLYPIPWFETVPDALIQYVSNPVFLPHELSLEIIEARVLLSRSEYRINFSVILDDIVIEIGSSGLTPEEVFYMIAPFLIDGYTE
ncbi:MAG: hypothetical protein FWE11_04575 [Defluviitaleaceae bacterium]|nr:hypothetical protein [Defluviitaleaceae bacterium]